MLLPLSAIALQWSVLGLGFTITFRHGVLFCVPVCHVFQNGNSVHMVPLDISANRLPYKGMSKAITKQDGDGQAPKGSIFSAEAFRTHRTANPHPDRYAMDWLLKA